MLWVLFPGHKAYADDFYLAQHNIHWYEIEGMQYVITHDQPLVITMNEVCDDERVTMENWFNTYGYSVHAKKSVLSDNPNCGHDDYWIMVATVGSVAPGPYTGAFAGNYTEYASRPDEYEKGFRRGWVCVKATALTRMWYICTTHLAASTTTTDYSLYGHREEGEFRTTLDLTPPFQSGVLKLIGGDFNLRPRVQPGHTYSMAAWYNDYLESDEPYYAFGVDRSTLRNGTTHTAKTDHSKIDYAFASAALAQGTNSGADIRCGVESDHCLYYGGFDWK